MSAEKSNLTENLRMRAEELLDQAPATFTPNTIRISTNCTTNLRYIRRSSSYRTRSCAVRNCHSKRCATVMPTFLKMPR